MKSINKYLGAFLISATILSGCTDDFLQKNTLTGISSQNFWNTEDDALMGLTACYDGLQNNYLYNGGPWDCGFMYMDCLTDNGGHFNWSGWMAGYDIANGTHTPSSWLVGDFWKASYEEIKRCNSLLANVGKIEMDDNAKNVYKAEAVTLRSLMYLNLTMTYQDVPYITKIQSIADANCPKTERAIIVDSIMKDLKVAAEVLPVTPEVRGRLTKGAAWAILARTALYNKKWEDAINYYRKIMALNVYGLSSDYSKLFTEAGETSSEIVFGVRFEGPGKKEGCTFNAHWNTPLEALNGTLDLAKAYYCTDGLPTSQSSIYSEGVDDLASNKPDSIRYRNRDPRLKATLFVPGMKWGNNPAAFYGGAAASYSTVYVYKYFNPYNTGNSWDGGQDFYVIRYPEILLSLAEALVEKGGYNYTEVTGLVNLVRARVHMPKVEDAEGLSLSKDALLQVIKHERRVETAFEGLRLFDLYRWKELDKAVANIEAERALKQGIGNYFNYEKRNFRGEMDYVWPIPTNEIDTNSKLEQHSLWK